MTSGRPHLFCFGLGFSARALGLRLHQEGWIVEGTCRGRENQERLQALGITAHLFDRGRPLASARERLDGVTDMLISVPPDTDGDPVLDHHGADLAAVPGVRWIGYLSTTGVYGDTGGALVNEESSLKPTQARSRRRAAAEDAWLDMHRQHGLPVHVFRLAGIYGPGRSTVDQVRAGDVRRVDKPGHLFSRIHVDDIAQVLRASMARPDPGRIYNVCDDEPAAPADVVAYACRLLGVDVPEAVPFDEAAAGMSAMALSFWADNRRVDNSRIKRELGIHLSYPDYRHGLAAVAAARGVAAVPVAQTAPAETASP
jgi:nucleoside-diphosphate-sugar epimerase